MEHPETIRVAENLALTYHSQGQWREAEKLQAEVLEQSRRLLGMEHPDTIEAAGSLAAIYCAGDGWHKACNLLESAVQLSMQVLGKHHPYTQNVTKELSLVYEELGRSEESQEMEDVLLS